LIRSEYYEKKKGANDFNAMARSQSEIFFRKILPRYIDLYYSGKGYYFLRKMLEDLDSDRFLDVLKVKKVSPRAKELAANAKIACPLRICPEVQFGAGESVVLGLFSHVERYSSSSFGGPGAPFLELPASEYRTLEDRRFITLYEGSFRFFSYPSEKSLKYQILKTIVHEYLHYFESYFFKSERLLTSREEPPEGIDIKKYSLEEARRMDRWFVISGYLFYIALFAALAAAFYIVFIR